MTTTTTTTTLYRALLREAQYPTKLIPHFRSLAETHDELLLQNAIYFLRAQRLHTHLLNRYNPLFDLSAQDRVAATAHRVGLNMPKTFQEL